MLFIHKINKKVKCTKLIIQSWFSLATEFKSQICSPSCKSSYAVMKIENQSHKTQNVSISSDPVTTVLLMI